MQDAGVGKHCEFAGCGQRDYLPIRCPDCTLTVCQHHQSRSAHNCAGVSRDQSETKTVRSETKAVPKAAEPAAKCSRSGCNDRMSLEMTRCRGCGFEYCLEHRFPENHDCKVPHLQPKPAPAISAIESKGDSKRGQLQQTRKAPQAPA